MALVFIMLSSIFIKGSGFMLSKTDRKICGTCQFWTGKRDPVFDRKGVPKIDISDTRGNCENCSSRFFDTSRARDAQCVKYSKWTELF